MDSSPRVIDAHGRPYQLGELLGKGGEGRVYVVEDDPTLVAKLYHQRPLPSDVLAKVQAMIASRTAALEGVSAWPKGVLCDPRSREALGILLPRVADSRQLHELYGTATRRRMFPEARWHHLLLAARNVAAAFELIHSQGIVVGDVNQGNLLVDSRMCVKFIDCDSFQVEANGSLFECPVGTPHFTPPELQSIKLRDVRRTPDHDAFGLAVLLFHLLFVGRHPFAGRYLEDRDMTIEKAIAERRFAYSNARHDTLMEAPPASLSLADLPASTAELFERAFRSQPDQQGRPGPRQWLDELDALIKQRAQCSFDQAHVYYRKLTGCPWCRIEEEGGPAFFLGDAGVSHVTATRFDHLDQKIRTLQIPVFPDLSPAQLPVLVPLKTTKANHVSPFYLGDAFSLVVALGAALCLVGVKAPYALPIGAAGMLGAGCCVIFHKACKERRHRAGKMLGVFVQFQEQLTKLGRMISAKHQRRQASFDASLNELKQAYEHYRAQKNELRDVLVWQRSNQLNRYLAGKLLQENIARIAGLAPSMLSVLHAYGVESALDVDKLKLLGIPLVDAGLVLELIRWREELEKSFRFKPEQGVSIEEAKLGSEAALRRFKAGQARRVLMGAKQLQSLAEAGQADVERDLKKYDELYQKGKQHARQLRDEQNCRRIPERQLNQSPIVVAGVILGVPFLCWILKWIFG